MNMIVFVLVTVVCSFNYGMTSDPCDDEFEDETDIPKERFTGMINEYALHVILSSFDKTQYNWCLFPINVVSILSTLYLGSNGTFADEFETLLKITKKDNIHRAFEDYWKRWDALSKPYIFNTLDFILVNNQLSLSETYEKNVTKYYPKSILKSVAFPDSLDEINHEIWELTNKSIKEAVLKDKVTPETLLFVVSAIYLKVRWDVGFPITETKDFYVQDTSYPHESMFVSSFFNYKRDKETQCDVVQVNMNDASLSLFFVVPIKGKKIKVFRNNMESERLKSWISTAGFKKTKVNLRIPKVPTRGVLSLKSVIAYSIFDKKEMDLSGMVEEKKGLFADEFLQAVSFEIGNSGTIGSAEFDPDAVSIEAVVPFVYFLVEMRTKMVLQAGKYTNPTTPKT